MLLAYAFAMENAHIRAEAVEASEFMDLAMQHHVMGVPRTVIDEVVHIEGAVPENALVSKLMTVLDQTEMQRLRVR